MFKKATYISKCTSTLTLLLIMLWTSHISSAQNTIREGTAREAKQYSFHHQDSLVIHISGGMDEKYNATQYAIMLLGMFADLDRTEYPVRIVIFYEETGDYEHASVIIYAGAYSFDCNGDRLERGDDIIHPYDVVTFIPRITEWHAYGGETGSRPSSTAVVMKKTTRLSKTGR